MGNLLTTLLNTAGAMDTFQKGLSVVANNVANANSPGFARQDASLLARRFDLSQGLGGGVDSGALINSRQSFLERSVLEQVQTLGRYAQRVSSLEQIESVFDVTQLSGISGAIDGLFQSFSQLSVSPNDTSSRQAVIRAAGLVTNAFQYASDALGAASSRTKTELQNSVASVNAIGERLQQLNSTIRKDARAIQDPGVEAQVYAALEELSEYTDFTVLRGEDGSFDVAIGGQTPLTIGDHFFPLEADTSGTIPVIRNYEGTDITSQIKGGRIRGSLDFASSVLPTITSDLNLLAKTIADTVNTTLQAGVDLGGSAPSIDLFSYNSATDAASTLAVTAITPSDLAAALASAPGGNGNALDLAALGASLTVGGQTFAQFYGKIAGYVGSELASARGDSHTQTLLVAQAHSLRNEQSGVSLDEEAAKVIEFQRSYQASAELVRVINSLTETLMGMIS